jgi:hypothetical protein
MDEDWNPYGLCEEDVEASRRAVAEAPPLTLEQIDLIEQLFGWVCVDRPPA